MAYPDDLEECLHGIAGPCTVCMKPHRQKEEKKAQEWDRFEGKVKAMYDSKCPECEEMIEAGSYIRYDENGEWIHDEC